LEANYLHTKSGYAVYAKEMIRSRLITDTLLAYRHVEKEEK